MKLLRIKLDNSLHARLKVQAAMDAESMQSMAVRLLSNWVDYQEERRAPSLREKESANA